MSQTQARADHSHHECEPPDETGEGGPQEGRTFTWVCGTCGRVWAPDKIDSPAVGVMTYWIEIQGPRPLVGPLGIHETVLPELEIEDTMRPTVGAGRLGGGRDAAGLHRPPAAHPGEAVMGWTPLFRSRDHRPDPEPMNRFERAVLLIAVIMIAGGVVVLLWQALLYR